MEYEVNMSTSPDFARRVYEIVALSPRGRVTTYGLIAAHLGDRRGARMVGWALNAVPDDLDIPCHRVVNRVGVLSGRWHFGHPDVMTSLLAEEGIPFVDEDQVDLSRCLWDPTVELYDEEAMHLPPAGGYPPPTK